jgi:2-haloacid dehalogenase
LYTRVDYKLRAAEKMTSASPRPSTVVFDLGGVLIDWNPRHLYRKIVADPTKMEWFLATVCTQAWHEEVDRGARPEAIVPDLARQFPQYALEIAAFYDRFEEMFAGPHRAMVDLLERLSEAKTPLFALTNWGADSFSWARDVFPFLSRFRDIVVSGEEGLVKPDPRIFRVLFERGGFLPDDAVFIDDNQVNVEAAGALGMHVVLHRDAAETIGALRTLGLPA